ncbi:AT-rich interactive domain-containing protein 1B-like isoform X2 [Antennarius striatus]|uniref:AT-rich interactive domain-containing protein 1B-like isoform X2 n=1 Tax=Antennarius striatus TaxID=241820 RepID=UPI0035AE1F1D
MDVSPDPSSTTDPPPSGTGSGLLRYHGAGGGGPSSDQHGGQHSAGTGVTAALRGTMDQVQNPHEGYGSPGPYGHHPNHRPGSGDGGYGGTMSPSRPGSGSTAANHSKTAPAASSSTAGGGFQRFPGQNQPQQLHPSGATPTLNQLLTSPSSVMRSYGSGYPDFNGPAQQASIGLAKDPQYGAASHGWGGPQRSHPSVSPGGTGQGGGRSQVAPPMDPMALKRSQLYGMSSSPYAQQGAPYSTQLYGSPPPHRYPMGLPSRGQMPMGGLQYPQQQVSPYGQQGAGGYHPRQPPYFSPPQQQTAAPSQPPYMQPHPLPQQEVPQEAYGGRGQSVAMTPGKPNHEEMSLGEQERPSSLPDLSGSIDDLPTGTEVVMSSGTSGSGSTQGNRGTRSPFSPHVSPRLPPPAHTGPSPSPSPSPASSQLRSGPMSPSSSGAGPQLTPQGLGPALEEGPQTAMTQDRGFPPSISMQRSSQGPQFGPQQSAPPMSPHSASGGHHGSYHQGSAYSQYGPPGNYPRPPHYGGAPSANYSAPGPGPASSPMHGHGPSTPAGRGPGPGPGGRPYPTAGSAMAPTSPGMPQPAGQGMGPPDANTSRKPNATSAPAGPGRPPFARSPAYNHQSWSPQPPHPHTQQGNHVSTPAEHYGQGGYLGVAAMGGVVPGGAYAQQPGSNSGRMTPQGRPFSSAPSGAVMMQAEGGGAHPDATQRVEFGKDGTGPAPDPPKRKKASLPTLTGESITRLYDMGAEPERAAWVERYLSFMEGRGTPVPALPAVGRRPLDLCRLYLAVRDIGGLAMVNKNKKWRELSSQLNVGTSSTSASSLKKQYIQYLFAYECQVERGEEPPPEAPGPDAKKPPSLQARIQPPSPAPLQGPHTPQSSSSSLADAPGDVKPPTPVHTPQGPTAPQPGSRKVVGVSVQDPLSDGSDLALHSRRGPSGPPYQQGGAPADPPMRLQYDANKDPYRPPRKGPGPAEAFGPSQMPASALQEVYPRGMGPRPPYPYGPAYEGRSDHVTGPDGGGASPGGPTGNDGNVYPNRFPQQRHGADGYGQQYHSVNYTSHQPLYPQQQGYKRAMEPFYPPAKRHEGEVFGPRQPDVFGPYGGGGGAYATPERRPVQGPYPYPYPRDRQGPPQHSMMGSGPSAAPGGPTEGLQTNMWPPRTDMSYTYSRPPHGPPYPGMGRGDDQENRGAPQDGQWLQPPYPTHSGSSPSMPPLPCRQPPSSLQATPTVPNHVTRSHSPSPFPRPLGGSLSPNNAPYMSMKKPPGAPPGPPAAQTPIHRDLGFPPATVEATPPNLKPRQRLTAKDVGAPEAWRVMMSLKSGLLAESTWALDAISVLLYDDSTVGSFSLPQLPGFLELMVEYLRRCLIQIFGILGEYEVGAEGRRPLLEPQIWPHEVKEEPKEAPDTSPTSNNQSAEEQRKQEGEMAPLEAPPPTEAALKEEAELKGEEPEQAEPRPQQASKYDKLPIKIEEGEGWEEVVRRWAELNRPNGFVSGLLHWRAGGGDCTAHIQTGETSPSTAEMEEEVSEDTPPETDGGSPEAGPLEDEARRGDDAPLSLAGAGQDALARRCLCVSNVIRGLSVVPGNDAPMSRHPGLVLILGRLLLLCHRHPPRRRAVPGGGRGEDGGRGCSRDEWRWGLLASLREDALVTLANVGGRLDLSRHPEGVCLPLLDGLLHWMVCPAAEAQDPFGAGGGGASLSPRRLALECLCKLSILDANVDLLLATPPFSRQRALLAALVRLAGERRSQVCREMAVATLSHLAQGEAGAARAIALQRGGVGTLVGFLEDGAASAAAQLHGAAPPPEPPSINMMCRAAKALLAMARGEENRHQFVLLEGRLLDVSLAAALPPPVAAILYEVLFKIGRS